MVDTLSFLQQAPASTSTRDLSKLTKYLARKEYNIHDDELLDPMHLDVLDGNPFLVVYDV